MTMTSDRSTSNIAGTDISVEHDSLNDVALVVLSHLRWDWVWQRPQHLISRLAANRTVWFVEEPMHADVSDPRIVTQEVGPVSRVWLEIPRAGTDAYVGLRGDYHGAYATDYATLLSEFLGDAAIGSDVWLYTPMALDLAEVLEPRLLVYDVMDDLANFAEAPRDLVLRQRRALALSHVVFAGGRSLHQSAAAHRGDKPTHLFPSGVEIEHYASARDQRDGGRLHGGRPVAGYVGVLDERLDLQLVAECAAALPDWDIQLVGPYAKVDPAALPKADNISYTGIQPYEKLPEIMGGFDVALMPFALNDATKSISPTKTLEYLAAGLPVVSTRVPDVVSEWSSVVHLADTGAEFAAACRKVVQDSLTARDARLEPLRRKHEWDVIADGMKALMADAVKARRSQPTKAPIA